MPKNSDVISEKTRKNLIAQLKKRLPKCPKCKKKIKYLHYYRELKFFFEIVKGWSKEKILKIIKNPKFSYIIGVMYGDGCTFKARYPHTSNGVYYTRHFISLLSKDKEFVEKFRDAFNCVFNEK